MSKKVAGPVESESTSHVTFDAVVIGAGFSGLYMLYRLREFGFSARVYERGAGIGGTWYWNRYPGARCDSESMWYSYSFLPDFEQKWHWTERYAGQAEVLAYLNEVADCLDLRRDIELGTEVVSAVFDGSRRQWTLRTAAGAKVTATYCITAVGCLSAANIPSFPGAETFEGTTLHTAAWPHEGVDFTGKRVGVIGTGASGIQAIPIIAEQADHLTVFQRTPNFALPAQNRSMDPEFERQWKADYREWRRKGRYSRAGSPYPASQVSVFDVTAEERERIFEGAWGLGGFRFGQGTFRDLTASEEANAFAADFIRSKIDEIVHDPGIAASLKPTTYPFGTKRTPLETDYYSTFNRQDVILVDLRAEPMEMITRRGVRTSDRIYELDILVYASGFDALTGPLVSIDIQGRSGVRLKDKWVEGSRTYLGISTAGFPNLFMITGPGSPSVLSNMPVSIEQHVEWIGDCLQHLRDDRIEMIEASVEAEAAWTAHVKEAADATLYPKTASWYMGANIPGKPRVFLPYVGGVDRYREKCDTVAANGYEGFELTPEPRG